MNFGVDEIIVSVGSVVSALGLKSIYPILNNWIKAKTETAKLRIKMKSSNNDELVELLKNEISELKEMNKRQLDAIIRLEIDLATLRERYAEKTVLKSRGRTKN